MKKLFFVVEWVRNDFTTFTRRFLIIPTVLFSTVWGNPLIGLGFVSLLVAIMVFDAFATWLSDDYAELVEKTRPVVA